MKLKEEKQLKLIVMEYEKALEFIHKKDFKKAFEVFTDIVDKFKDSEYYSVQEIQTRAKVFQSIAGAQVRQVKIRLQKEEDYIYEGIFQLNSGNYDRSLELFQHLEKSKYNDPYLYYLLSVVYLKKDSPDKALQYLGKCIKKDDYYKVLAYNDPDFESLMNDQNFLKLVE